MGFTSIIEFDHDRMNEIFEDKESQTEFIKQIREQLSACKHNGKEILGCKILMGFHRSGKIYDEWIKFKRKMGW